MTNFYFGGQPYILNEMFMECISCVAWAQIHANNDESVLELFQSTLDLMNEWMDVFTNNAVPANINCNLCFNVTFSDECPRVWTA